MAAKVVGTTIVAQSAPNGYTFLLCSIAHAVNPAMLRKLPYDSVRDFIPVSFVTRSPLVLVVNPVAGCNMRDFITLVRSQPGKINYASSGSGSVGHLAMELLKDMTNLDIVHVPFKGAAPAATDLKGGHVHVRATNALTIAVLVVASKLRMLAMTGNTRAPQFPDLPTIVGFCVDGH